MNKYLVPIGVVWVGLAVIIGLVLVVTPGSGVPATPPMNDVGYRPAESTMPAEPSDTKATAEVSIRDVPAVVEVER